MSIFHILAFVAPLGIIAAAVSLFIGVVFKFYQDKLQEFAPAAQFKLCLAAAILPVFISVVFLFGASFGRVIYGETDWCLAREHTGHFSNLLVLFSIIYFGGVLFKIKNLVVGIRKEKSVIESLKNYSKKSFNGCRVVPFDEPQALVLGTFKSEIYISQGLIDKFDRDALDAIIAHEKAHVARRDPLWRFLASDALVFHLPMATKKLDDQLRLIQELIADGDAGGRQTESRIKLAQTLIGFARTRVSKTVSAFEFGSGNIEIRVRQLLDADEKSGKISLVLILSGGFALLFLAIAVSRQLHLLFEFLLKLF